MNNFLTKLFPIKNISLLFTLALITACAATPKEPPVGISTSPSLMPIRDEHWVLAEDFTYIHNQDSTEASISITVPKGFVTDLASIPIVIDWFLDDVSTYAAAALVHDYLFWMQPKCEGKDEDYTQKVANKLYHDVLLSSGVTKPMSRLHWVGVSLVGYVPVWSPWKNRKRERSTGKVQSRFVPESDLQNVKPFDEKETLLKDIPRSQKDTASIPQVCSIQV